MPFLLTLLAAGLIASHGVPNGAVELEVLSADGSELWAWNTDDAVEVAVAAADVRRAVEDWHVDSTWETTPGPYCPTCPVREWCPDRDLWQALPTPPVSGGSITAFDDEPAPF